MDNTLWLHIYSSAFEHNDAWIVGNTAALKALRDAINKTLEDENNDSAASTNAFALDGEGFCAIVLKRAEMKGFVLPYPDEVAGDWCGKHPYEIIGAKLYDKLTKREK